MPALLSTCGSFGSGKECAQGRRLPTVAVTVDTPCAVLGRIDQCLLPGTSSTMCSVDRMAVIKTVPWFVSIVSKPLSRELSDV